MGGDLFCAHESDSCFVTVKTVEANLTRIYGKLGIRSRTELARLLVHKSRVADKGGTPN